MSDPESTDVVPRGLVTVGVLCIGALFFSALYEHVLPYRDFYDGLVNQAVVRGVSPRLAHLGASFVAGGAVMVALAAVFRLFGIIRFTESNAGHSSTSMFTLLGIGMIGGIGLIFVAAVLWAWRFIFGS